MGLALFVGLAGCTSVDNQLGMDLVPDDQRAVMRIDTITAGMNCYQYLPDSIVSQNQGYILCGKMHRPEAGVTTTTGIMQFLPAVADKTFTYGFNPVVDSMVLSLQIYDVQGDTTIAKQKQFYVYEVPGEALSTDTTVHYRVSFNPEPITNSPPLFTFSFSGTYNNVFTVNLTKQGNIFPAGRDYLNRLAAATTDDLATSAAFHDKFGGLCIAPAPGTVPEDGAIIYVRTDPTTYYNTYFSVYSRNFDQTTLQPKDTLETQYWFDSSYNISLFSVEHDYTGTPIQAALANGVPDKVTPDNGATPTIPPPLPTVYSHSPAGATPMIRFTDQLNSLFDKDNINSLLYYQNTKYSVLVINRAEIQIPVTEPDNIPFLDASPQRLGMYYNYNTFKPIPDFLYAYESQYGSGSIPFGGYLQRAKGHYSMDITSYVQRLATEVDKATEATSPRNIYLGMPPIYQMVNYSYYYFFDPVFSNAYTAIDTDKIRLILTCTLIR